MTEMMQLMFPIMHHSPSLLDGLLQQLLQRELLLVMLSHEFVHLCAV